MKKLFLIFAMAVVIAACSDGGSGDVNESIVTGESGERLFSDAVFNEYCQQFDTDGDGVLSTEEAEAVTDIVLSGDDETRSASAVVEKIKSVDGLERFVNLEYLAIMNHDISSLDISKNINLTYLDVRWNNLTSLDISKNVNLTWIDARGNNISHEATVQIVYDLFDYHYVTKDETPIYTDGITGMLKTDDVEDMPLSEFSYLVSSDNQPFNKLSWAKGWIHTNRDGI